MFVFATVDGGPDIESGGSGWQRVRVQVARFSLTTVLTGHVHLCFEKAQGLEMHSLHMFMHCNRFPQPITGY